MGIGELVTLIAIMAVQSAAAASAVATVHSSVKAEKQARLDARAQRQAGVEAQAARRRQARRLIARQKSARAAAGVEVESGTPVDLLADTAAEEELSALFAGFPFFENARLLKAQGKAQRDRAFVSAATSILGASLSGAGGTGGLLSTGTSSITSGLSATSRASTSATLSSGRDFRQGSAGQPF